MSYRVNCNEVSADGIVGSVMEVAGGLHGSEYAQGICDALEVNANDRYTPALVGLGWDESLERIKRVGVEYVMFWIEEEE